MEGRREKKSNKPKVTNGFTGENMLFLNRGSGANYNLFKSTGGPQGERKEGGRLKGIGKNLLHIPA